jgi:hypothetical protein
MLISLTTEIGHALPSEECKVALDPRSDGPFGEISKLLAVLLAIKNGGSKRDLVEVFCDGGEILNRKWSVYYSAFSAIEGKSLGGIIHKVVLHSIADETFNDLRE